MSRKKTFIERTFTKTDNEESAQAVLRLLILIPFFFFFSFNAFDDAKYIEPLLVHILCVIYGVSYFYWIKKHPMVNHLRRNIALFLDITMVSIAIIYVEWVGLILYPLYIWVIVGNGMRYGRNYVFFGIIFAVLEFATLLVVNDFWINNFNVGMGLLVVIIILPLFFLIMLARLQVVNEMLREQLLVQKRQEMILLQQSRHAAMGEMISNIAHQWRQPLNALGLLLQNIENMYEMDMLDDAYMKKSMDKGGKLTQTMSKTIDDFRDFFQPNKERKVFNLSDVVEDSLSIMEATFNHSEIEVFLKLEKSAEYYGYKNELSQAILNILTNARDVLVHKKVLNAKIWITLIRKKESFRLSIQDNGGGIALDTIDRVFEPYFTTKNENKGTGIGLYMSKLIIEKHLKGSLNVKNSKDGAEFTIILKERIANVSN